jgi:hypothetical protein
MYSKFKIFGFWFLKPSFSIQICFYLFLHMQFFNLWFLHHNSIQSYNIPNLIVYVMCLTINMTSCLIICVFDSKWNKKLVCFQNL